MVNAFCFVVIVALLCTILFEVRSDIKESRERLSSEIESLRNRWEIRYSIKVTDTNYKGVLASTTWVDKLHAPQIPYVPNVGDEIYIVEGNTEFYCKVTRVFHNMNLHFTLINADCYQLIEKEGKTEKIDTIRTYQEALESENDEYNYGHNVSHTPTDDDGYPLSK